MLIALSDLSAYVRWGSYELRATLETLNSCSVFKELTQDSMEGLIISLLDSWLKTPALRVHSTSFIGG